jgi:hypothetical protein
MTGKFDKVLAELSDEDKLRYFDENGVPKIDIEDSGIAEFSMFIDKAVYNKESQELRWHMVASDTDEDSYDDNMTLELFEKFLSRIESQERPPEKYCSEFWDGGEPYLSISHYSDQNGAAVPGEVQCSYIDGEKFKAKGTFFKNRLGMACFDAINADKQGVRKSDNEELDHPVRVSIAFLDYKHEHKSNGKIFIRESLDDVCPHCILEALTNTGEGKKYLDGHLIHYGMTRIPVNKRTDMEVSKSMATRKDDAKSIVGDELAEKMEENETTFRSELVIKSEEETEEVGAVEVVDKVEEVPEVVEEEPKHILQESVDALLASYTEVSKSELDLDAKLEILQRPLENLANVTRASLEGRTVAEVQKNDAIDELRQEVAGQFAEISQQLQILSQAITDKSNVQDTQVPAPRSIQPEQQVLPVQPVPQPAQLTDNGYPTLKSLVRRSTGAS